LHTLIAVGRPKSVCQEHKRLARQCWNTWRHRNAEAYEMMNAIKAIRGSGKRRALTTWYANSIKIIKQRDAGRRIGKLLAAQTDALMRMALLRRAFLFFRLRAAALVVAAFEARMAVLMDDHIPVDPYVVTIHRKNTLRKYVAVWNRGASDCV
jgi:hypothetical protein